MYVKCPTQSLVQDKVQINIIIILVILLFCFQSEEIGPVCLLETRWLVVARK